MRLLTGQILPVASVRIACQKPSRVSPAFVFTWSVTGYEMPPFVPPLVELPYSYGLVEVTGIEKSLNLRFFQGRQPPTEGSVERTIVEGAGSRLPYIAEVIGSSPLLPIFSLPASRLKRPTFYHLFTGGPLPFPGFRLQAFTIFQLHRLALRVEVRRGGAPSTGSDCQAR